MSIIQAISNPVEFFNEVTDPRTDDYFLMSSPIPTLALTFGYLIFVQYVLPAYMKSRPAYNLKNTLLYYNLFQVILSSVIVYMNFGSGFYRRFSILGCRELDLSFTDPDAIMALQGIYLFYLSKFTEFMDTIFFVLRKKNKQVTFLHLFHHASMPFNTWLLTRAVPGGSSVFVSGINASVHVVMYTYYLLSGLGPRWQKYLWWKKYLTTIQLIQFAYGLLYIVVLFVTPHDRCPVYMKRFPLIAYCFLYFAVLISLFSHFYMQTYKKEENNNEHKKVQKIK